MKLFDLHCDTLYECCETGKRLRENDLHINRAAAQRYAHYAQFFALFCGARAASSERAKGRRPLLDTPPDKRLGRMLDTARQAFAENADWLAFCRSAEDLRAAADAGKAAGFLSIEGAELLPARADALDVAYAAGIRLLTLTWNYRSRFGCAAAVSQEEGLTDAGRQLVRDCVSKGIIVDVSHLSERGFWDVCETIDTPFAASHSNAFARCQHIRNLTDRQFSEIVRRGGLVGINLYVPFLVQRGSAGIDDAIEHIAHFLALGGEKTLALGCDFDGCDQLPEEINGLADMYRLADRMLARGYKQSMVDDLFYHNAFAFIQKML